MSVMETTVLENEMHKYFTQLNDAEKNSVIQMIKTFLQSRQEDNYTSIEQYNLEIDEAEAQIEKGESFSHEEVINISNTWLHGRR